MIVNRMNARVENRTNVGRASLRLLPQRRTAEFTEFSIRVSKYGLFSVKGTLYSAPSRLVGHRLSLHQFTGHTATLRLAAATRTVLDSYS